MPVGKPELPGFVTLLAGFVEQALVDVSEETEADADEFDVMSPAMFDLVTYRLRELINVVKLAYSDAVQVRVQARRVDWWSERLGAECPAGADRVLEDDTDQIMEEDNRAHRAWCEARGVEWLEIRGDEVRIGVEPSPECAHAGGVVQGGRRGWLE